MESLVSSLSILWGSHPVSEGNSLVDVHNIRSTDQSEKDPGVPRGEGRMVGLRLCKAQAGTPSEAVGAMLNKGPRADRHRCAFELDAEVWPQWRGYVRYSE